MRQLILLLTSIASLTIANTSTSKAQQMGTIIGRPLKGQDMAELYDEGKGEELSVYDAQHQAIVLYFRSGFIRFVNGKPVPADTDLASVQSSGVVMVDFIEFFITPRLKTSSVTIFSPTYSNHDGTVSYNCAEGDVAAWDDDSLTPGPVTSPNALGGILLKPETLSLHMVTVFIKRSGDQVRGDHDRGGNMWHCRVRMKSISGHQRGSERAAALFSRKWASISSPDMGLTLPLFRSS